MSSSEANVEKVVNCSVKFGNSNDGLQDGNGDPTLSLGLESASKHQVHSPKCLENGLVNALEAREMMNSNHVLQPAKIEKMKQSTKKSSPLSTPGKTVPFANCVLENNAATVGASGDGSPYAAKVLLHSDLQQISMNKNPEHENKEDVHRDKLQPSLNVSDQRACLGMAQNHNVSSNDKVEGVKCEIQQKDGILNFVTDEFTSEDQVVKPTASESRKMDANGDCKGDISRNADDFVSKSHLSVENNVKSQSRMKLLVRSKAICQDDVCENLDPEYPSESPLSSSSTFISDSIFPSPFPISREEAIKETVGHMPSRHFDDSVDTVDYGEKGTDNEIQVFSNSATEKISDPGSQQDVSVANADTDLTTLSLKPNNAATSRREPEKPPRMQKQRSQDRLLLLKQQKPSFDSDVKREALSRDSSFECVDSTGVVVHEFLINTLRNSTRDRVILLKLEHDMMSFVNDKTIDFMKFPPMTSYHRMLVHRVAAYFGMDHNVDETGKSVIINKTSSTRLPDIRFAEHFDPRQVEQPTGRRDDDMRRRSILKRTNHSRSFDRDDMQGRSMWKDNRQRSIEEREEEYEKIRARIFNNPEASLQSPVYGRRNISSLAAAKMASWTDRPWNSTDMESMPSTVRMPLARPLTTRASSYSSISLLPRHNSATSIKTGSSSSVSSMSGGNGSLQTFPQNRQVHSMGNPRPPTPVRRGAASGVGDSTSGTFYYMQQQNQEFSFDKIEDDIAESCFEIPESPEQLWPYERGGIVPTDVPILLAVPSGITLPPETVLCHPITGMPYLSPEGYQLVYQSGSGSAGSSALSSPQFAQYYQMPPQPSPQHPGVGYMQAQGYNPYQESQQKALNNNMVQRSNATDYAGMAAPSPSGFAPISNYQQIPSSSSTAFAQNMSYSYQPSPGMHAYRPSQEQSVSGQMAGVTQSTQSSVSIHPAAYSSPLQAKQQAMAPYGNQNAPQIYQRQPPPASPSYQAYALPQPANSAQNSIKTSQTAGVTQQGIGTAKDAATPAQIQNPSLATAPRAILPQPPSMMPPPPASHQYATYQQQPMQLVYSPTVQHVAANAEGYHQGGQRDGLKPCQIHDTKSAADKELNEKMQAIVLKNLQKQGISTDAESVASLAKSTSPSTKPMHQLNQAAVPETSHQFPVTPVTLPMQRPEQQAYPTQPHYQYANTNGVQPQQTMQVYLMPRNNQVPGGPSYRTYSQFMTQPQTPHVMGPGMHFVYLSPPMGGVVGMEGPGPAGVPPNAQVLHNHSQQYIQQLPTLTTPTHATNTNNNNAMVELVQNQQTSDSTAGASTADCTPENEMKSQDDTHGLNRTDCEIDSNAESTMSTDSEKTPALPNTASLPPSSFVETVESSTANSSVQIVASSSGGPSTVASSNKGQNVMNNSTAHDSGIVLNDQAYPLTSQHVAPRINQPLLLGTNVPRDYRMAGVSVNNPASFNTAMVPQYTMYQGMNAGVSPYVKYYLPAPANRGQKLPEMKVYQGAPSPSPGLVAVQLPNQNQIQYVQASMPPPNPVYYAPHNHMATDYNAMPASLPKAVCAENGAKNRAGNEQQILDPVNDEINLAANDVQSLGTVCSVQGEKVDITTSTENIKSLDE